MTSLVDETMIVISLQWVSFRETIVALWIVILSAIIQLGPVFLEKWKFALYPEDSWMIWKYIVELLQHV